MIDPHEVRGAITAMLSNSGPLADLSDLADLGAVQYVLIELMAERMRGFYAQGYSSADLDAALNLDVMADRLAGRDD